MGGDLTIYFCDDGFNILQRRTRTLIVRLDHRDIGFGDDDFDKPIVGLANGYSTNDDIYAKNNRVRRATFLFTDGQRLEWEFDDSDAWQEVPLARAPGPNMTIAGVTIIIDDVSPGSLYDDTCIGEVEIWGRAQ